MVPLPSVSTSVASKSGDASAGLDTSFNYSSAFQVGGSGEQKQDAGLSAGAASSNVVMYVALAVGVLGLIASVVAISRRS